MNGLKGRRGEPLIALGVILGGWLVARAMLWSPPFAAEQADRAEAGAVAAATQASEVGARSAKRAPAPIGVGGNGRAVLPAIAAMADGWAGWRPPAMSGAPAEARQPPFSALAVRAVASARGMQAPARAIAAAPPGRAVRPASPRTPVDAREAVRRWRIDGWAMVREGSSATGLAAVGGPSAYGASQSGAMLRYRLGDGRADSPLLFARASRALVDGGETELGLGLGWRPLASLPIAAYADLRVTDGQGGRLVRPAAYLVTEFAPWRIDERIEAEAYLQAGYVAGDFATPFVDGQARIERRMARFGDAELRLGPASWGGAQDGAARLDLGPSASLRFAIRDVPVRLSVDYRFRVAGEAEPGSGAAVTIVSGF